MTIQIKDTYKKETLEFLSSIPQDAYEIKDPLREELARRIKDIDEGREKLVPLDEGMERLRAKLKEKYAHCSN